MSGETSIEWTDASWNPTTGCDKVSPGCDNCYAMTLAPRLKAMGSKAYQEDGDPRTSGPGFLAHEWPGALEWPLHKKKPLRIFVNSMADLFHKNITDDYIARVFAVMAACPQHEFQVLTKRPGRMRSLLSSPRWPELITEAPEWPAAFVDGLPFGLDIDPERPLDNVWLGVSVEDQKRADLRIRALLATPAAVRFLSCEPLLGPVKLEFIDYFESDCQGCSGILSPAHEPACGVEPGRHWGIDWVIAGGESGPGARPMHPDWARSLRDQCATAGVPFLFKQWGNWAPSRAGGTQLGEICMSADGDTYVIDREYICAPNESDGEWLRNVGKKAAGRELDGRTWDEYPSSSVASTEVKP